MTTSDERRLDSWKEIAAYLKRDVRTVQRWERNEGLPVHRKLHGTLGSVFAFEHELDAWWNRDRAAAPAAAEAPPARWRLAVLPLRNLSGDPAQDYFAEGLTEELSAMASACEGTRRGEAVVFVPRCACESWSCARSVSSTPMKAPSSGARSASGAKCAQVRGQSRTFRSR